jgi:hypothetical protein
MRDVEQPGYRVDGTQCEISVEQLSLILAVPHKRFNAWLAFDGMSLGDRFVNDFSYVIMRKIYAKYGVRCDLFSS